MADGERKKQNDHQYTVELKNPKKNIHVLAWLSNAPFFTSHIQNRAVPSDPVVMRHRNSGQSDGENSTVQISVP